MLPMAGQANLLDIVDARLLPHRPCCPCMATPPPHLVVACGMQVVVPLGGHHVHIPCKAQFIQCRHSVLWQPAPPPCLSHRVHPLAQLLGIKHLWGRSGQRAVKRYGMPGAPSKVEQDDRDSSSSR